MGKLSERQKSPVCKLIFIGNSGSGKTGALTSLVKAGYRLRILDMDNGLDALASHVQAECPDKLSSIEYETVRDKYKATPQGPQVAGSPKAYVDAVKLLDRWSDGTVPGEWGQDTVFVLDSLTQLARSAFAWARGMNPGAREPRQWYKTAQDSVEDVIAMLTSETFNTNVIVISHIDIREQKDGTVKGFANSIGSALGPRLPAYFNTWLLAESSGTGKAVKRKIKTMPTTLLDLKNPAPMKIEAELPLETGLATVFEKLRQ
jgi:hypothetical protein